MDEEETDSWQGVNCREVAINCCQVHTAVKTSSQVSLSQKKSYSIYMKKIIVNYKRSINTNGSRTELGSVTYMKDFFLFFLFNSQVNTLLSVLTYTRKTQDMQRVQVNVAVGNLMFAFPGFCSFN